MNTYTVTIDRFIVDQTIPNRPNYVSRIIARVHGVSESGKGAILHGGFDVMGEDPTTGEFIPMEQLTPEISEQWIRTASGGAQWAQFIEELDRMIGVEEQTPLTNDILPPWLEPTISPPPEGAVPPVEAGTSSTNTSTVAGINEEALRAMIYQVLEEVNSGTV